MVEKVLKKITAVRLTVMSAEAVPAGMSARRLKAVREKVDAAVTAGHDGRSFEVASTFTAIQGGPLGGNIKQMSLALR